MNLQVTAPGGETHLHVTGTTTVGNYPSLGLWSSDVKTPNIDIASTRWDPGVAWSVHDRTKNGGDLKGRAIALWFRPQVGAPSPFAVLTWHVEGTGPFYVFSVGSRNDLGHPLRMNLERTLMGVLLEAATRPAAPVASQWQSTLRWSLGHFDHAPHPVKGTYAKSMLKRAKQHGFQKHQPPPAAPKNMTGAWLGERSF